MLNPEHIITQSEKYFAKLTGKIQPLRIAIIIEPVGYVLMLSDGKRGVKCELTREDFARTSTDFYNSLVKPLIESLAEQIKSAA